MCSRCLLRQSYTSLIFVFCTVVFGQEDAAHDQRLRAYLDTKFPAKIESVVVDGSAITVRGSLCASNEGEYLLCEIKPYENITEMDFFTHSLPLRRSNGRFAVCVQRYEGTYDRIYSRWAVVERIRNGERLASHAVYPTNILAAAKWCISPRKLLTKKGLNGIHPDAKLLPDLIELGVGSIVVNVNLGSLISLNNETIEYDAGTTQLTLSAPAVRQLDMVVEFADKHGIVVSAVILVPLGAGDNAQTRLLCHPDACAPGHYSLANVTNEKGVRLYAALMRFLAERYSRPDASHGRITNWILHNEVDSAWLWTSAGEKSAVEFMDQYVKSMRIAYYSVRTFNSHAKVFISLTHCWNESFDPSSAHFYRGRELLELLERYSRAEGDFEWGVAYHPYPRDLFNADTWNDEKTDSSFDTPYITPKNIEVLARWFGQKAYRYNGETVRSILLSEQGFHSGTNDEHEQQVQAAALAYIWKKIKGIPCIEEFDYHRWIDHEFEGGLHLGLWTVKPGSTTWPEKKKLAYDIFKALGTANEDSATEFALKVIGIGSWAELLPEKTCGTQK